MTKQYKWEALAKDEVPQVYHVNHVKRLRSSAQNTGFEGQLPKLRYYHHIKKVEEPIEENNNKPVSIKTQPITASAKKNGSAGQMKITGKLIPLNFPQHKFLCANFCLLCRFPQREKTADSVIVVEEEATTINSLEFSLLFFLSIFMYTIYFFKYAASFSSKNFYFYIFTLTIVAYNNFDCVQFNKINNVQMCE